MGLKIANLQDQSIVTVPYDEDITFDLNPAGLPEWRIVSERRSNALVKLAEQEKDIIFSDDIYQVDKNKYESLFDVQAKAAAKFLIKGWMGDIVLQGSNETAEFSESNAVALIQSNTTLLGWILSECVKIEAERHGIISETVGKQPDDSNGSQNGAEQTIQNNG